MGIFLTLCIFFQIISCVDVLNAVVKRCVWPDDPDRALRGGFVVARTESWNPIYRNPATPHFLPLLPGLLALLQCFNALSTPQAMALLSEVIKISLYSSYLYNSVYYCKICVIVRHN